MNLFNLKGDDEPITGDADLVRRAQRGEIEAVGDLYDRHQRSILRYVWARVGDQQLAEDLSAQVFERMVASLATYRSRGIPFKSWLFRIAHNLVVDHVRKESRYSQVPLDQAETMAQEGMTATMAMPEQQVEEQYSAERIQQALQQLDPLQQNVVILRFLAGLSLREVATALGKSVPAIKSLQHRGLVALRATLKEE